MLYKFDFFIYLCFIKTLTVFLGISLLKKNIVLSKYKENNKNLRNLFCILQCIGYQTFRNQSLDILTRKTYFELYLQNNYYCYQNISKKL